MMLSGDALRRGIIALLKDEAKDGACPVCGEVHRTVCPECDRPFKDHDTYCLYCGFIRNQPLTSADEMKKESGY